MGISAKSLTRSNLSLADALFTTTQQRVLGILFGQPHRSFYANELIELATGGAGAIQRELKRLSDAGLLTVSKIGNQKHYQANPSTPIFDDLVNIVLKTIGLANPIKVALQEIQDSIIAAFVFGSVAQKTDTAKSDIDLMIISDTLQYADIFAVLEKVSQRLGRIINPTVYSRAEWNKRNQENNAFITKVMAGPKIWLMGDEDVLTT
jgi:predicted nucleotidyltransferase